MPYTWMYILAVLVLVASAIVGAILLVPSDTLGLNSQTVGWLGVVAAALGTIASFLPRVNKPPSDIREGMD